MRIHTVNLNQRTTEYKFGFGILAEMTKFCVSVAFRQIIFAESWQFRPKLFGFGAEMDSGLWNIVAPVCACAV